MTGLRDLQHRRTLQTMIAVGVLVLWALVIAVVDHRTGRIPNRLVLPAVAGTAAVAVLVPAVGLSALVLVVPYAVAFAMRAGGGGDVKLAVPCGGLLADPASALVVAVIAALITLVLCAVTRERRRPHAPTLVLSTGIWMLLT